MGVETGYGDGSERGKITERERIQQSTASVETRLETSSTRDYSVRPVWKPV